MTDYARRSSTRTLSFSMAVCLMLFTGASVSGQKTMLSGRVVDKDNKPVQGAQVRLVKADTLKTTDSNGNFQFDVTKLPVLQRGVVAAPDMISLRNGTLSLALTAESGPVRIEMFDTKGQCVCNVRHEAVAAGVLEQKILPEALPPAMYVVKVQTGSGLSVFKVLNTGNRTWSLAGRERSAARSDMKRSARTKATVDTIVVTKDTYLTTRLAIQSYVTTLSDIVLMSDPAKEEGLSPVTNGKSARTTRYWDCCKPHCGWHSAMRMCDISGNDLNDPNAQSGCSGGTSFQCWDYAPIEVNSKVSYGWAAFNNSGTQCGDCFQLDFQGAASGKQMIVQVINIGDGGTDAFDLLIPGGGVGALNGCSRQWNNAPLGQQYGGFHATCGDNGDCILNMCKAAFGDKQDLMRGCNWYVEWFKMANNPNAMYMKVPCPQAIKDISKIGN